MSLLDGQTIIDKIRLNADEKTLHAFYDVRSIDDLPDSIPYYPIFIIINTHTKNLPGEHWKVIFIDKFRNGEIFDSLAIPVNLYVSRWMNKFTRKWRRNLFAYQHPLSTTCGAFAIYYVMHRLNVTDQDAFLKTLSANAFANELKVTNFYLSLK